MISSLADSSIKAYDVGLKKWWIFCKENCFDPFLCSISNILTFLKSEYDKGVSRGTLNSYRSAVAILMESDIGQDKNIKRFFKAVSNIRPAKPKYDYTWNPKLVLDYFSNCAENSALSLENLTMKVCTLLALVTAQRMQTLLLIEIDNIKLSNERIEIPIAKRIKTSGHNRVQPYLRIPFFHENQKICAAQALLVYIEKTKDLRQNIKQLFISYQRPHKAVSSQTLSRWIKSTLEKSGVDTNVFTAYSTRHSSTSTAKSKGLNIDLIKKTAGWTAESTTFAHFYDLPIQTDRDQYARSILHSV